MSEIPQSNLQLQAAVLRSGTIYKMGMGVASAHSTNTLTPSWRFYSLIFYDYTAQYYKTRDVLSELKFNLRVQSDMSYNKPEIEIFNDFTLQNAYKLHES